MDESFIYGTTPPSNANYNRFPYDTLLSPNSNFDRPFEVYSFVEAFTQAIGKALGLGYHPNCACPESFMAPDQPQPVNNTPSGIPPRPPNYIDSCTKCAFKSLYCPDDVEYNFVSLKV